MTSDTPQQWAEIQTCNPPIISLKLLPPDHDTHTHTLPLPVCVFFKVEILFVKMMKSSQTKCGKCYSPIVVTYFSQVQKGVFFFFLVNCHLGDDGENYGLSLV